MRLKAERLVHVFPNRGAVVISLSPDEVREVYEMRLRFGGDLLLRSAAEVRRRLAADRCGVCGNRWRLPRLPRNHITPSKLRSCVTTFRHCHGVFVGGAIPK